MATPKEKHKAIRAKLRAAQQGACCYCAKTMRRLRCHGAPKTGWPPDTETLEHLKRRADGGTATTDNVALSCYECNAGRGALDWFTYKTIRAGEMFA